MFSTIETLQQLVENLALENATLKLQLRGGKASNKLTPKEVQNTSAIEMLLRKQILENANLKKQIEDGSLERPQENVMKAIWNRIDFQTHSVKDISRRMDELEAVIERTRSRRSVRKKLAAFQYYTKGYVVYVSTSDIGAFATWHQTLDGAKRESISLLMEGIKVHAIYDMKTKEEVKR